MKRVITTLLLVMACCIRLNAQIGAIRGQVSYQQYYRDYEFSGGLTKLFVRTPVLDLRTGGSIISPRILSYSLFSSVRANYISVKNNDFTYSGDQYSWNRYNLITRLFPYAPVKLTLTARENSFDLTSKTYDISDYSANRQQEQRADLAVYQVSWLPTLSMSYVRNRSYTVKGNPSDIVNQTLTFGASGSTDTSGSYTLNVTMVDMKDRLSIWKDRFLSMQFSASRAFSERHAITLNADFEQYLGASILGLSTQYSGDVARGLRITSVVRGSNTLTIQSQSRSISLSQSASYRINNNFQTGIGATGFMAQSRFGNRSIGQTNSYSSWASSGNIQHQRTFSRITMLNAVTLGYGKQQYSSKFYSLSAGLSNSLSRSLGPMSLSGNYSVSYIRVRSSASYDFVGNNAGLVVAGKIVTNIQSQTDVRYSDARYPGDVTPYRNQRTVFFTQRFDGSFIYYIPLTLSLSGTSNWYMTGLVGHSYNWTFNMSSPSFFLPGLFFNYTYLRTFDPYYHREVPEHNASMSYRLRALSFTGHVRYVTFPIRSQEYQFSVARPF